MKGAFEFTSPGSLLTGMGMGYGEFLHSAFIIGIGGDPSRHKSIPSVELLTTIGCCTLLAS